MKKLLAIALAGVLTLAMAACGAQNRRRHCGC